MKDIFFQRDAYKNNTFSLEAVENALNHIQMSSFQYLHQVQLDMTEYKRFDFTMSDVVRSNKINHVYRLLPRRWVLYVPGEFIHEGKRYDFRHSKYYEKEITYDTTLQNRKLFSYTFLVFIDGKLFFKGVNMFCKEDKSYIVFNLAEKPLDMDGIPKDEFEHYQEINAKITVIFMPNYANVNVESNAYAIDKFNNSINGIPYAKFGEEIYDNSICFVRPKNSCYGYLGKLEDTGKGFKIESDGLQEAHKERDTTLYLNFLQFKHLHKVVDIGLGVNDTWFELKIEDYPIAVDNCFIFDKDGNYMHDLTINMFYPNIYHINGDRKGKELKVYIFYYKSNMLLKHRNALAVFYKYTKDVLARYQRDSIPNIMKNYTPYPINYRIKDYHGSQYFDDHFKYKVEKMRTLTKEDGEWFRDYLVYLALKNNYGILDISKISNLKDRIRNDNSDTGLHPVEKFSEPMYMFVFNNSFKNQHSELTIDIDGIRFNTHHLYKTDQYDYLYVPCSLLKENSLIEFEKMVEVIREIPFTNDGMTKTSIDLDCKAKKNRPLMNDLFVVDAETELILSPNDYETYARVGPDMLEVVNHDLFLPCTDHVEILVTNPEYMNKPLMLHIKKNHRYYEEETFDGRDNLAAIQVSMDCPHDVRHLRVYRNGRVIPRHIWFARFPSDYKQYQFQLFPGMLRETGDVIAVECVPYKINRVAYIEDLTPGKIIDLTGKIDKPFDLRWHDVYLNGKKLNRNDIEIISCNKIIIRKTKSLHWLEVVENSRDDEYFGYMPLKDIIDDMLDSGDDDGLKERIEETIDGMTDVEDEIVTEIVTIWDVVMNMFYFDYMIPYYGLINPDYLQISKKTHDYYHEIMDGEPFLLNPDYGRKEKLYRVLPVNPDYEFGDNGEEKN